MAILAIDQGTTSTRAWAIDKSGKCLTVRSIEHKQYYPRPGWVEHDPEELVSNIQSCIDSCQNIETIGIDNQGESCLAWDAETKQAITPVIVWQDSRTQTSLNSLQSSDSSAIVLKKTGLPLDAYFSASKLGWIVKNVPQAQKLLLRGTLRLGTTDSFFLDRLTGHFLTDVSTASRTSLMNIHSCDWDQELCDLFGVPLEALAKIVPTNSDFGFVLSNGNSIPVTANIVDQQAALHGHGCKNPGDIKITFGTGAFALAIAGNNPIISIDTGLLSTVAWQLEGEKPVYALDGGVYSAGSSLNWLRALRMFTSYDQINHFKNPAAISRDLAFVPALTGLGCPYWDRKAAGLWIGLSLDTSSLDMVQSVLEGIAFRTAEVICAMDKLVPTRNEISIDGGVSTNPYFCQFLADVLDLTIITQSTAQLTAYGTAKLAAGTTTPPTMANNHVVQKYTPESDKRQYLEKYKSAVDKSTHWRT